MKILKTLISMFFLSVICFGRDALAFNERVDIGGFISQGYLKSNYNNYLADSEEGSFQFNEMGLYFSASPVSRLRLGCQFFARDLGDVGNDEMTISWAFAEYKSLEWFGVRTGLVKLPHGFHNDSRDMDMLRTFIFLPQSVYNEWFRDGTNSIKGVEFFGNFDLGVLGSADYQIMGGATNIPTGSGTAKFYKEVHGGLKELSGIRVENVFIAQSTWATLYNRLRLKIYYAVTAFEAEGLENKSGFGLPVILNVSEIKWFVPSIELVFGDLIATAEYYVNRFSMNVLLLSGTELVPEEDTESYGYYLSLTYRLNDWFQFGTYCSNYKNDNDLTTQYNFLKEIVCCARFDINSAWVVKIEYHRMDGLFGIQPGKDGSAMDKWNLYAIKMSYYF